MTDVQKFLQAKFQSAFHDFQGGRLDSAENSLNEMLKHVPGDPQVLNMMAGIAARKGDDQRVVSLLEQSLAGNPSNPEASYNLGTHLVNMGRYEDAVRELERTLSLQPGHASAAFNLGKALTGLDRTAEAATAYRRALQSDPNHVRARAECAKSLLMSGAVEDAGVILDESIRMFPEDPELRFGRGFQLPKRGEWEPAIADFDFLLSRIQWHVLAVAFKSVALHEAGRSEEAAALNGPEGTVRVADFSSGFSDQQHADLGDALADHVSLAWERPATSTKGGGQTGNLDQDPPAIVRQFTDKLKSYVNGWIAARQPSPENPFSAYIPKSWDFSIWATVLRSGGHQTSHLHPAGWLSGVYYVDVPDVVANADNTEQEGWIEFGQPGYEYEAVRPPLTKRIQPEVGKLILFPSSVFHRTVPFRDDQRRISIAFDVRPTA